MIVFVCKRWPSANLMSEAAQFLDMLRRDGHVCDPQAKITPLSGGVSSEIYLVDDGAEKFIVKRALAKLRVKDDWFADISRNVSERNYFEHVGRMMPGTVPKMCFANSNAGYFGMEFLGDGFANWKQMLLLGDCRREHSELAGKILGEIHRRTYRNEEMRNEFDTTATFHQLRVEPYLLTTGARHPELQEMFVAEAQRIETTREVLVHGDFSPKNILICGDRMVLLDCEVAWYGDPVFDVAFLLSHLFLKSLHHGPRDCGIEDMVDTFWRRYAEARGEDSAKPIEQRLVPLLLMLLLARVDGKSPVEYLAPPKQQFIRDFMRRHIPSPPKTLAGICDVWFTDVLKFGTTLASK